jgi:hypothetical protein
VKAHVERARGPDLELGENGIDALMSMNRSAGTGHDEKREIMVSLCFKKRSAIIDIACARGPDLELGENGIDALMSINRSAGIDTLEKSA